jgi:EAL domain-containing protein (putative c-di-GMP-specific phosphodiesterase class I)/GGDEF domain-containing protein
MNQRIGHSATDNLLLAVAQALQSYPSRIERCCVGRLNGADFALLLPVGGLAAETAAALVQALHPPIHRIDAQAMVATGAVELHGPLSATQALALADAALACAEADGKVVSLPAQAGARAADDALPLGETTWQRRIGRALVQGFVALGEFPVQSADGRVLHLDCPLRLRLSAGGPLEPASRWLAMANRSRLCSAVDEKAVALALEAIARDGRARCVNVAAQSAASAEFISAISRRLEAAPAQACRLWIDLPESMALARPMLVREVARRWRPLGVMMGLEHAGEGLARIPRLIDLGLDCVRIDSRFVNGIADAASDDARRYLLGLVRLVQSVGLQVCAEGVRSPEDLELLWEMGFDAATGPALGAVALAA